MVEKNESLRKKFDQWLHQNIPGYDQLCEAAVDTVYTDIVRKLTNIRIQEFISSTCQVMAAKKGKASTWWTKFKRLFTHYAYTIAYPHTNLNHSLFNLVQSIINQ